MDLALFATFLAACGAAAATGAMFGPGAWYLGLKKPWWTPPGWLFPVAWTTLYICMAAAAARVAVLPGSGQALAFWAVQIAFNTLWTPVFFGLHRMRAAMVVMVGLWLAVAASLVSFAMLDTVAGLLMAPYLLWVTIAGTLNFTVMRMNPEVAG
jgi:benzodiazapine receptor